MEVLFGTSSDIEQWMKLVKRVSWNFPGLETEEDIEEHSQTVLKFMNKKQALCIKCKGMSDYSNIPLKSSTILISRHL